jgi:small subunit ribosomal protein S6
MERNTTTLMRPYELMYLLPPTADEERLKAVSERLESAITSLGGKVDKVVAPARRRLAYEVEHHRDGHYGVVEFSLPPEQSREFDRTIRLTEDILRHLVVRRDE